MLHPREVARALADAIADRLASPAEVAHLNLPQGWWPQSLAYGAAGIALLHIERARTGIGPWRRVHDWLTCAAADPVCSGEDSHLHYGAPALALALHAATAERPGSYAGALATLDLHIATITRRRLERAHARIDRGELPLLAEFDAIRGLTGLGACLLRQDPRGNLFRGIVAYLVRLTEPIKHDGDVLPGWWTLVGPGGRPSADLPGGHANNGVAHGIGGPLALLSLAYFAGVVVEGHAGAIERICDWLDRWRQHSDAGPWWPYLVTRRQVRDGRAEMAGPLRPSWCYGTAGLGRAQQLAGRATGDMPRQQMAEHALARALSDPLQLAAARGLSLCHGQAGLIHIAGRAAADAVAHAPDLTACAARLLGAIVPDTQTGITRMADTLLRSPDGDPGLLEGAAGVALAMHAAAQPSSPPVSGWDACFLIAG